MRPRVGSFLCLVLFGCGASGASVGLGAGVCACSGASDAGSSSPFHRLDLVAGNVGGAGSLDGTGSTARFNGVLGLASDGAGNLYAADATNDTIRKIVLATGEVTTIAGSAGQAGSVDGTGSAARFNGPKGVAFDSGNLYVADSENSTIRKIALGTGAVTTIAGAAGATGPNDGVGAAARFSRPNGIASDGAGTLYVADTYNDVVRQIVLATQTVTTILGASDGLPDSVVTDGAGKLYVAGYGGTTVSKVDIATGQATSIPVIQTSPFGRSSTALAIDRAGSIYFADSRAAVFKLDPKSGVAALVAGSVDNPGDPDAGAPVFTAASGLALDGGGNIYVADGGTTIRKVDLTTSAVTMLAGSSGVSGNADGVGAAAAFDGAAGLVLDSNGNLYVADQGNASVRKIALASNAVTTVVATPASNSYATLRSPAGLALDRSGNLVVADDGSMTIRELDLATQVLTTLAGEYGYSNEQDGVGADPNGVWQPDTATFASPTGIAFDAAGILYVTDQEGPTVRQIAANGSTDTVRRQVASDDAGLPSRLRGPAGIVAAGTDYLYVADSASDTIWKIVVSTGEMSVLAGTYGVPGSADGIGSKAQFNAPIGLASDGEGNLFVADRGNSAIRELVIATQKVTTVAGAPGQAGGVLGPIDRARLNAPTWLAYGPGPTLYVSDGNAVLVLH
jgi:sugar lactone lactonase YvrE